jgi:hypothetical protein
MVGLAVLAGGVPSGAAGEVATGHAGAGRVGPDQYFTGVVNGTNGNTVSPIPIQMACFGPVHPGQTGHPLKGQTLAVHQLFPPSTVPPSLGATGDDSEIGVFFNAPPPTAAPTAPVFTRYDKTKHLSTKLTLPCSGTGTVWFTPIPVVPPSESAAVPVEYVSQP